MQIQRQTHQAVASLETIQVLKSLETIQVFICTHLAANALLASGVTNTGNGKRGTGNWERESGN